MHLTAEGPRWERTTSKRSDAAVAGNFLDGRDHRVSLILPLERLAGDRLAPLGQVECRAEVVARDGRPRDRSPLVRCDLVDGARNTRLIGVPVENVRGPLNYRTQWLLSAPASASVLEALAAGTAHAELVLGVHGGGDYTEPDRVNIVDVTVSAGPAAQ